MMKNIDTLSSYINPLIYQNLVTTSIMRYEDLKSRPYAYNYNVFHSFSKPRHVYDYVCKLVLNPPSLPTPSTLHHNPLRFLHNPSIMYLFTHLLITSNFLIPSEKI